MGKASVSHDTRVEIITLYKLKTFTYEEIAEKCNISAKCVFTTVKNFLENGSVDELARSGRPRKTSLDQDKRLFHLAQTSPTASSRSLSADTEKHRIPKISHQTVIRRLNEFDLESHLATAKPLLTDVHKQNRLAWCKARQNWGYEKWASVIFSDESNYMLINRKTTARVWRFSNEKYDDQFIKKVIQGGGGSVGVWGCIGQQGTGCCATYPGRLNSERYIDLLENNLKPSLELLKPNDNDWYFQQDGASCHTAKSVKAWFSENNLTVLQWPSKSPDLNPIEHLWAYIDTKLEENPPETLADLEVAITKIWNEIDKSRVISLIESMPKRVDACIKARGSYTKY